MIPESKKKYIINKIEKSCQSCSGEGCMKCRSKIARISSYSRAGIPVDYWNRSWKDFSGDPKFKNLIKEEVLSKINEVYDTGRSFAFVGNLGVGKSYAACAILRMAITSGFKAKYLHMEEAIRLSISDYSNDFYSEVINTDFLCIDEYDSRWVFPSEKSEALFGQTMESILRNRFQNNMPTIVCSNTLDISEVVSGEFSKAIDSLFSKHMRVVYVSGKDFRKK